jgi:hypothetical protein
VPAQLHCGGDSFSLFFHFRTSSASGVGGNWDSFRGPYSPLFVNSELELLLSLLEFEVVFQEHVSLTGIVAISGHSFILTAK